MPNHPIIFSAPMVRALLAGRKTQTRRLAWQDGKFDLSADGTPVPRPSPWQHLKPGDRLWVRESVRAEELSRPPRTRRATAKERALLHRTHVIDLDALEGADGVRYEADGEWRKIENTMEAGEAWAALFHYRGRGEGGIGNLAPPIHMPRWASRLTLTVTAARVERLQAISEADAQAEGVAMTGKVGWEEAEEFDGPWRSLFANLWNSLHGPDAWEANPEVVCLTFTVAQRNIDA